MCRYNGIRVKCNTLRLAKWQAEKIFLRLLR